jgi:hypothetical protein
VAVSTTLLPPPAALTRWLPIAVPVPLAGLILAAAGMAQRWRVSLARSKRALKLAEAKRAERNRLPRGSRVRSAANFQAQALDHFALALQAEGVGAAALAAEHHAMSTWFDGQAQRLSLFGFDRMAI